MKNILIRDEAKSSQRYTDLGKFWYLWPWSPISGGIPTRDPAESQDIQCEAAPAGKK